MQGHERRRVSGLSERGPRLRSKENTDRGCGESSKRQRKLRDEPVRLPQVLNPDHAFTFEHDIEPCQRLTHYPTRVLYQQRKFHASLRDRSSAGRAASLELLARSSANFLTMTFTSNRLWEAARFSSPKLPLQRKWWVIWTHRLRPCSKPPRKAFVVAMW